MDDGLRQPAEAKAPVGEEQQSTIEQEQLGRSQEDKGANSDDKEQATSAEDKDEGFDDNDYDPDFVHEALNKPPILPGESEDAFVRLFESFEFNYKQRPKTDLEYFLVLQATIATWELMRYERMKIAMITIERPSAVESLHRKYAAEPSTKEDVNEIRRSARDGKAKYLADPDYRKQFVANLERAGFGPNAVEGTAFFRALPSLTVIDRLIKSAEKRLADCLKKLDAAYATREPEQPMPRSLAARHTDDLREREAQERRKARQNGQREADRGE